MIRLFIFFVFLSFQCLAQSSPGRQALSRMEKEKWEKAEEILHKALLKDSLNVEAKYVSSLLFFNRSYPRYNIDSAHHYILSALRDFYKLPVREKEKLKRIPLDSLSLLKQKEKTDSLAFDLAKALNTESSFNYFLREYNNAKQSAIAVELRDGAAYDEALKINTYKSFDAFLKKYPSSPRATEAREKYDKLIYHDRTRDGSLKSHEAFVKEFPASPYALFSEEQIFEISTANGSTESFVTFIQRYPRSKWSARARDLLFHLDENFETTFKQSVTDSLKRIIQLNHSYWVPFLKSGRYGFMDQNGEEKLAASFEEIQSEYLCGDIRSDYFITSQGIVSRNGKVLLAGEVKEVKDLGDGFLKVGAGRSLVVLHKSGFSIHIDDMKDARVLAGRFLLVNKESGWGITSLNGRLLVPFNYEEITSFDDWIILTKNRKKIVVTADQIGSIADKVLLPQEFVFDDVKRWAQDLCWVRNGALEGVINEALEFVIPLDRHLLSKTSFGFLKKKGETLFIEGVKELQNISFDRVTVQGQWLLAQQKPDRILLYDINSKKKIATNADSIWFDKNIALVKSKDSIRAWINRDIYLDFSVSAKATLFGRDSSAWIVVEEKNKKVVYDGLIGKRLFITDFEQIESPAPGYFLVTRNNKKGLCDEKDKVILPVEYDAIIQPEAGKLSLLKDKKFGLFDMVSKQLIKPMYERNIIQYNRNWFVAYKDGGWGFIHSDSKPIGKFQFSEVQFWNDTAAWVKENSQWKIFDIKNEKVLLDKIKDFQYVKKYPHEHIVIIHQDNYYGVISNRSGVIIPSSFTDIINLGDKENPLYFTEKHVEEADISVVIYYDHAGKPLRKQAFEGDEYERILCGDN